MQLNQANDGTHLSYLVQKPHMKGRESADEDSSYRHDMTET